MSVVDSFVFFGPLLVNPYKDFTLDFKLPSSFVCVGPPKPKIYLPCRFNYNIAAEHKMSLYVCLFVFVISVKDVSSAPSTDYCQMEFTTSLNYQNEFARCYICVTFPPAQTSVPQCFLTLLTFVGKSSN